MELTIGTAKRIEQLPRYLKAEFPQIPSFEIEHDVEGAVRNLIARADFDDYVPLLVHKTIRERLRDAN